MSTLAQCRRFVELLAKDGYELRPSFDLRAGMTAGDIARVALTPASLIRYVEVENADLRDLRRKYGLEPIDAHDADGFALLNE